jgi:tyrosinase
VNNGNPIHQGQPGDPLSVSSLGECAYEPHGSEMGFCMRLDFGLHGNVHVLVGNSQNMGSVPWAASDPIFWLHHANIDRLWASWNKAGLQNPHLSQTFSFADKSGKQITGNIADFLEISQLGYTYDRFETVPKCPTAPDVFIAGKANQKRLAASKATGMPIKLGAAPVTVALETSEKAKLLTEEVDSLRPGEQIQLVFEDLQADAQPSVLYHIYVDLPADAKEDEKQLRYVGSLNFFHAVAHGDHEHAQPENDRSNKFVSFDITELAKKLRSQQGLGNTPSLTIAPSGSPADNANPTIGRIVVVAK